MAPGARSKFGAPCSKLRSFGSKCTVLKKVLVVFLELFGVPHSHSTPPAVIWRPHSDASPGEFRPPSLLVTPLSWSPPDIFRIALQIIWCYVLQGASGLSANWNWSFDTSCPQWLTISQGMLCDLALSIEIDETKKADIDEIINKFASIKAR